MRKAKLSGGMEEQTALGRAVWCWLEYDQKEGPASSHYSWNRSRVNTRQSPIGHCTDLQQETEQGWGYAARSGTGKKKDKKEKRKGHLGENSCAVVEVGIKSDAEQRGCFVETVGSGGEEDEVQTTVAIALWTRNSIRPHPSFGDMNR
ncbi:hypothetical protein PAMP_009033 [Pampus punctatissimus]